MARHDGGKEVRRRGVEGDVYLAEAFVIDKLAVDARQCHFELSVFEFQAEHGKCGLQLFFGNPLRHLLPALPALLWSGSGWRILRLCGGKCRKHGDEFGESTPGELILAHDCCKGSKSTLPGSWRRTPGGQTQRTGWRMKKLRMTSSTVESAGSFFQSAIQSSCPSARPPNSSADCRIGHCS